VCLLGSRERRHGPAMHGSIARFGASGEGFRGRAHGLVKRRLLCVEHVSAQVVRPLVSVELCLVSVAAVLGETQLGLTAAGGSDRGRIVLVKDRPISVERQLGFVQALLVAVGTDLFAFGDALVQIDQRLLLVELVLAADT
jgi:hypothetical protein